jgi:hypothetical protein
MACQRRSITCPAACSAIPVHTPASSRRLVGPLAQAQADAVGIPLDTPAEELAGTLIAVFEGYVLQKLIDPQLLPDDFFVRLLQRCFGRLAELDRHQQASQPATRPAAR